MFDNLPSEYGEIPSRTLRAIARYIEERILPGSFLTAVLKNNLADAVGRADEENSRALHAIVRLMYNHVRGDCWGSQEKVTAWLTQEDADDGKQRSGSAANPSG